MNNLINERKIYERAFYPFGDNLIVLPHRIRTYIDFCSYEFECLHIEDKLCNLGFAVTRGLNLYAEIEKDINEHVKDTPYKDYEAKVKRSLFTYIDYLRETETFLTETLFEQKDVKLKQLIDLLVEEVLLRYNEHLCTKRGEYVAYFARIPIDYTAIINRFKNDKQSCYNYLLTSQETISKATISKDHILYLNRWKELLPKLSGDDLYFKYDMVFPGDEKYVYAYNDSKKSEPKKQLILNVPPEPWSGNILNSKLILLSLNPRYVEHLNKSLANMFKPQIAEEIMQDKRFVLSMNGIQFDYYEPTRILGEYYWYKNIAPLGNSVYGEQSMESIWNQISVCQYLAYTSLEAPAFKNLLPSQRFTKMVLLYLATSAENVKFLILRASSQWKTLMGEGLWNYLRDSNRLMISKHYRSQRLSEQNIGTENYRAIIEHLRAN